MSLERTLVCVCAWKVFLLALAVAVWAWMPGLLFEPAYANTFQLPGSDAASLATRLSTWDAQLYLHIARHGYADAPGAAALYPLWPALVGALGGSLVAALALSHALFLAACAALYLLVRPRHGEPAAAASVIALTAYPGSFFFGLAYSESLFLLLAVLLFGALDRRHWAAAALLGALLPLTRAVGVLAILPIAWSVRAQPRAWITASAPLLGFAGYLAILHWMTGNAFTGFEAQSLYVSAGSLGRLGDPLGFAVDFFRVRAILDYDGGLLDRLVFLGYLGLLVPVHRTQGMAALAWVLGVGMVSAVSLHLTAFLRYVAVLFPLFVAIGVGATTMQRPALARIGLRVALAVQALLLVLHTSYYWVG